MIAATIWHVISVHACENNISNPGQCQQNY
jgi:hypothetical protein